MTDTIVQRPGDIVLLHRPGGGLGVSAVIRRVTKSNYTHSMLVVDEHNFTDARLMPDPDGQVHNDIGIYPMDALGKLPVTDHAVLFERVDGASIDATALLNEALRWRDAPPTDQAQFSVANLAVLALLRFIGNQGGRTDDRARLWNATICVANDGPREVFCSEYVFGTLKAIGAAPQRPDVPFVDLTGVPVDVEVVDALWAWLGDRLDAFAAGWIVQMWDDLQELWHAVGEQRDEFVEVAREIQGAYHERRQPELARVAEFTAPVDLANSSSYRLAAHRLGSDDRWTPGPPPPTSGDDSR